ncbi:MarR family transcriptional regulator [Nocardioides sp. C4-1]|uniref:MarR family winged helix-turn-helix transcriptional regulator n=1 Tax=Nocardioides sp. C4-1 TaxID=3151851 RepID=UPI00326400F6
MPVDVATAALDRLLELTVVLGRDMSGHLAGQGLTESRAHLLFVLHGTGPTTQRALADALDVTPRTVTGLVDGLEASGHITREPHPTDRRATLVTPTPAGAAAARALAEGRVELARALFADWRPDDVERLTAGLDAVLSRVQTLVEESS